MTVHLYGIPNCDTVKKARRWLDERKVSYVFHDFKKEGVSTDKLAQWADQLGWETLLNRKGTTWRQLPEADKQNVDLAKALTLMQQHTSSIKRPVVESSAAVMAGFDESRFEQILLSYT